MKRNALALASLVLIFCGWSHAATAEGVTKVSDDAQKERLYAAIASKRFEVL